MQLHRLMMNGAQAALAALALGGSALAQICTPTWTASPQFSDDGCVFENMLNPKAQPSQPAWKIWSRFLDRRQPGTAPVDPIPVRRLDRAALDALDPAGQPHHPARPLVAPAQAARQVLADRPGVRRTRLAGQLGRAEALPCAAADAGRAAADRRPDPVARPLRPPRRADHRVPERPRAALLRAAGRGRAAAGHGRGRADRIEEFDWWQRRQPRRRATHRRAGAALLRPHAVGPQPHAVGRLGHRKRRPSASSTAATRATFPASSRSASASAASTWR